MPAKRLVSVISDISQVDEPVFATIGRSGQAEISVLHWNDYGISRARPDMELGLTPVFPALAVDSPGLDRSWFDRRIMGVREVAGRIADLEPELVVLNDIPIRDKVELAVRLRAAGLRTAFRSDKNRLSCSASWPLRQAAERMAYRTVFPVFCPTSRLTSEYYGWTSPASTVLFPYATDEAKFGADKAAELRGSVRGKLGIPLDAPVVLAVTKLVDREGPLAVIEAFAELRRRMDRVHLILVGSGPLRSRIESAISERRLADAAHLCGYVPFAELQDYFFAADVFVHLANQEPWGVSVTDALCAGLGVVTSDGVGAGLEFLTGDLAGYVTPRDEPTAAAAALEKLFRQDSIPQAFAPARARVLEDYSVRATAARLYSFGA